MDQLTQNWLQTLCKLTQGVSRAVVFLAPAQDDQSEFTSPVASWPEGTGTFVEFIPLATEILTKGKGVVRHNCEWGGSLGEPRDIIGLPLLVKEELYGVVVLELSRRTPAALQLYVTQVESAGQWFATMVGQQQATTKDQLVSLVELVASCLEYDRFDESATGVATDFSIRMSCDRVAVGVLQGNDVMVAAISHSAGFDQKSSLVRDMGEAMHEAIDQDSTIVYPPEDGFMYLTRNHTILAEQHDFGAIVTIPFLSNGKVAGAILVERPSSQPFDEATKDHFEQIVSMIGPILEVRRRDEQWLQQKLYRSLRQPFVKLFGPKHLSFKLVTSSIVAAFIMMGVISSDYRVTSKARLEAKIQRVVVASQDGYVASSNVRPGDIIKSGDILGGLDDKDLSLQSRRWASQIEQLQKEYRNALAKHDRSNVSIINAKILQARAQLNLIQEQLSRTRFTAPFDGLIVSGDLSQSLGSPVQRGQVLFTVAPLDAYRVVLRVDERDIGEIKEGQRGNLLLSGMAGDPLEFTIEKITPVSIPEKGRNVFQVEAKVEKNSDLLRPGMEGVAKIDIDSRKLIWIWGHTLMDWVRLKLWELLP